MAYEFAEIFKRAGMRGGWVVSIRPTSPKDQILFDQRATAIKKFIAEAEQAHQATRNSTLRFSQKITTQSLDYSSKKSQLIRC